MVAVPDSRHGGFFHLYLPAFGERLALPPAAVKGIRHSTVRETELTSAVLHW